MKNLFILTLIMSIIFSCDEKVAPETELGTPRLSITYKQAQPFEPNEIVYYLYYNTSDQLTDITFEAPKDSEISSIKVPWKLNYEYNDNKISKFSITIDNELIEEIEYVHSDDGTTITIHKMNGNQSTYELIVDNNIYSYMYSHDDGAVHTTEGKRIRNNGNWISAEVLKGTFECRYEYIYDNIPNILMSVPNDLSKFNHPSYINIDRWGYYAPEADILSFIVGQNNNNITKEVSMGCIRGLPYEINYSYLVSENKKVINVLRERTISGSEIPEFIDEWIINIY